MLTFGGGLAQRPTPELPPVYPTPIESCYIRQLLDAYGHHTGVEFSNAEELDSHDNLKSDYLRQRTRFYSAESLRNFARDNVPEGTFDALQDEIYYGVIDVCEGDHTTGFNRMRATVAQAVNVGITSNPLTTATKAQDRQGICHQLANEDRLKWMPDYE